MENTAYLLNEFSPFSLETTISDVKDFFKKTTFSHFPVVAKNHLIGIIAETDVEGLDENSKEIGNFQYLFQLFFSEVDASLLEIITIFASNEANVIPVLDTNSNYIGYFDIVDILHLFNETPFFNNEGIVVMLEKENHDFSFSEICQIVESNNGKICGLFLSENNSDLVKITLKFDSQDVNEILQSLRRYNYKVISNHKEDFYLDDLKERSKYLQKYLNI